MPSYEVGGILTRRGEALIAVLPRSLGGCALAASARADEIIGVDGRSSTHCTVPPFCYESPENRVTLPPTERYLKRLIRVVTLYCVLALGISLFGVGMLLVTPGSALGLSPNDWRPLAVAVIALGAVLLTATFLIRRRVRRDLHHLAAPDA